MSRRRPPGLRGWRRSVATTLAATAMFALGAVAAGVSPAAILDAISSSTVSSSTDVASTTSTDATTTTTIASAPTSTDAATTSTDAGTTTVGTTTDDSGKGGNSPNAAPTRGTGGAGGNPSADLDQCANGPASSPPTPCDWVNGNLGASKAQYLEGESIGYRMRFGNLDTAAAHTVTIEWDATKQGKHAIDYLTSWDRSVSGDPCAGVSGSVCASAPGTLAIPQDAHVPFAQIPGAFALYGGTIDSVSGYSVSGSYSSDSSTSISIHFHASVANPVLAWGGHVGDHHDWGSGLSAISVPGSPYHMRLLDLDGSGGNQDRSLSEDAVTFPASVTVVKQATPEGATSFPFTAAPSLLASFSLVDDGTPANTKAFTGITSFTTYTIAENTPTGWSLAGLACAVSNANGGTSSTSGTTATVNLKEGEDWTCTYTNQQRAGTLIVLKHVINDNGGTATASSFTMTVSGDSPSPASFPGAESPGTTVTLSPGSYGVTESGLAGYSPSYSADCSGTIAAGQTKTCTVTNDDRAAHLTLVKRVVNDNGGTATANEWTLSAAGPTPLSGDGGSSGSVSAGTYALAESAGPSGYAAGTWSCDGGSLDGSNLTLALDESATCTVTNDDVAPKLHLRKTVVNDDGGTVAATAWTLAATGTSESPTSLSGPTPVDSGPGFKADTYTLGESGPGGYTASGWSCVSGERQVAVTNDTVSVALGDDVTCTIANDDNAPPPPPPPPTTTATTTTASPPPPAAAPAPAPAPAPKIDLAVTKADSPDPDLLGHRLTYRMVVTNNGPSTATGVQLADPIPAGAAFVSVATTKGTCSGGSVVSCRLGTLAVGESATVTLVVKPAVTGLLLNTVTVVGSEAETNTANNTASASTLVTAPFRPPVVTKPVCYALTVAPRQLTAGRHATLRLDVKAGTKPVEGARVELRAPGILRLSGKTNARGRVNVSLRPRKPGILGLSPVAYKGCNNPRVGIVGVFTPPVTG